MHTEFRLDQKTIEAAFRNLFAAQITACGLQELPATSLRSQYAEIDYVSRAHIWSPIKKPAKTEEEKALRNSIRDEISNAVLEVSHSSSNNHSVSLHIHALTVEANILCARLSNVLMIVISSQRHLARDRSAIEPPLWS